MIILCIIGIILMMGLFRRMFVRLGGVRRCRRMGRFEMEREEDGIEVEGSVKKGID